MKGTIEQVWENKTQKGQQYFTVQIGGERYSVWDQRYFDQLRQGAEIDCEVRESGNFKHLMEIKAKESPEAPAYRPNGKDAQITRMSCLKSASEVVAPFPVDLDSKRVLVLNTARYFERYVLGEDLLSPSPQEPGEARAGKAG